jgi:hypothetical protein
MEALVIVGFGVASFLLGIVGGLFAANDFWHDMRYPKPGSRRWRKGS